MRPLDERLARDLNQIADQATPSSTAWDSIRTRIDDHPPESDMEVIMLSPDTNTRSRRSWVPICAVAAAAVLLGVAGVLALSGGEEDDSVATGVTGVTASAADAALAVAIAEDFVEARDSWDGEAVRALVADDAVIDSWFVSAADEYLANSEFERATGWRYTEPKCAATVVGPAVEATCTYTMENTWSQALGRGLFTGSSFKFVIVDGEIQEITHDFDFQQFYSQSWAVFQAWVTENYPDDFDVMYSPTGVVAFKTPEAIALWEQHTAEFAAIQPARNFVKARDNWDGEAVRALVADDAAIADGTVSSADEYLANSEFERATGWRFAEPECAATVVGPAAEVTCTYTMENSWSEALDAGPFGGSSFKFVIADGEIQEINHDFAFEQFSPQVWEVFKGWVRDNYPDDIDIMYDPGAVDEPTKTPEALALWEQHTSEFAASLESS